ncbi:MAG TPA: hypothetical protein VNC84_00430 [Gammaproteobacteria bacterium]|nr:hypothetical protein [Gammaproteobacteria bacterium]
MGFSHSFNTVEHETTALIEPLKEAFRGAIDQYRERAANQANQAREREIVECAEEVYRSLDSVYTRCDSDELWKDDLTFINDIVDGLTVLLKLNLNPSSDEKNINELSIYMHCVLINDSISRFRIQSKSLSSVTQSEKDAERKKTIMQRIMLVALVLFTLTAVTLAVVGAVVGVTQALILATSISGSIFFVCGVGSGGFGLKAKHRHDKLQKERLKEESVFTESAEALCEKFSRLRLYNNGRKQRPNQQPADIGVLLPSDGI